MADSRKSKVISLSAAQFILLLLKVVAGMIFARVLTTADYGTYLQTFLAYDIAVPVFTLGLPSALYYFLARDDENQKGIVLNAFLIMLFSGVLFSLFLSLGGSELLARQFKNEALLETLQWMTFYPIYTFPVLIAGSVWIIKDKVRLNTSYTLVTGAASTLLVIIAAVATKDYQAPVFIRLMLPLIFLPVALWLTFKYVPGEWGKPDFKGMARMVKFAIPLGLAFIVGNLTLKSGNFIVSSLTSPETFAAYAIGAKQVPLIGIITGSISVVTMADMAGYIRDGRREKALELFRRTSVLSAGFLIPIMVLLFIFAGSFIKVLYTGKYEESTLPFRIYLFMLPIRIIYYGPAFVAFGKTKPVLVRSLIELLLTVSAAWYLTRHIGFSGAAFASVAVYYIFSIPFNLWFLSKEFKCSPLTVIPFKDIGRILLISLCAGAITLPLLFIKTGALISLVSGSLVFCLVYFIISLKFLPEFNHNVKFVLSTIMKGRG